MQATAMHFVIPIPDWNSLDSVRHAHSDLAAAALVFFALLVSFDVLAHLSEDKNRERRLERIGLCFFAIAVFAEIAAYPYGQRNDTLSEQMIGSLDSKAKEAETNASVALTTSGTALSQSKEAETKSSNALDKAGQAQSSLGNVENKAKAAQTASMNALKMSNDARDSAVIARREADSFEKDIKSAKEKAAEAESHLADALKEASAAQAELNLLKTPRLLISVSDLVAALKDFKDTKFGFLGVYGNEESTDLATEISTAVQLAGWKPTFSPTTGVEGPHVWLKGFNGGAVWAEVINTGVHVEVTTDKPEEVEKLPLSDVPPQVKAAIALKNALALAISPTQEGLKEEPVNLRKGGTTWPEVLITVGSKKMIQSKTSASH